MGKSTGAYDQLLDLVQKTGFTDISIHKLKIPCGSWPKDKKMKEIGLWGLEIAKTGVESYGLAALTRVLGMPTEEAEKIIADATADTQDRRNHSYWRGLGPFQKRASSLLTCTGASLSARSRNRR